jgi:hypothetical protein
MHGNLNAEAMLVANAVLPAPEVPITATRICLSLIRANEDIHWQLLILHRCPNENAEIRSRQCGDSDQPTMSPNNRAGNDCQKGDRGLDFVANAGRNLRQLDMRGRSRSLGPPRGASRRRAGYAYARDARRNLSSATLSRIQMEPGAAERQYQLANVEFTLWPTGSLRSPVVSSTMPVRTVINLMQLSHRMRFSTGANRRTARRVNVTNVRWKADITGQVVS